MAGRGYKQILSRLAAVLLLGYMDSSFALGTAANTVINNTAVVDYQVAGVPNAVNASVAFTIEELLDVNVVSLDAANVSVVSPSSGRQLTFLLTNTGNGSEQFLLSVDTALAGDNFDPVPASARIWIDANGDNTLDTLNDILYNGTNGPVLDGSTPGNDAVAVFVLADIPAGRTAGELANVSLIATSVIADAAGEVNNVGAEITAGGDGGVDANIGVSGAQSSAIGTFEVVNSGVSIAKSVLVFDTQGGQDPHPGAVLRYTLQVTVSGASSIDNLVITDSVPANTTYVANSIVLDGVSQTDAGDAPGVDFSDFNISNANTVTVDLSQGGNITVVPPASFTIGFEVTID